MISAYEARNKTNEYLNSHINIQHHLSEIESAIKECADKGGSNIAYSLAEYSNKPQKLAFVKGKLCEALFDYGYNTQTDFFDLYIYW